THFQEKSLEANPQITQITQILKPQNSQTRKGRETLFALTLTSLSLCSFFLRNPRNLRIIISRYCRPPSHSHFARVNAHRRWLDSSRSYPESPRSAPLQCAHRASPEPGPGLRHR